MIILLKPDVTLDGPEMEQVLRVLRAYPGVTTRTHAERGQTRSVIEVHVIGNTAAIPNKFRSTSRIALKRITQSVSTCTRSTSGHAVK